MAPDLEPFALGDLEACLEATVTQLPALDDTVVLADGDGNRYCLAPAVLIGLESASVTESPGLGFQVGPVFTVDGIERFNRLAVECFDGDPDICPTRQVAVVVDGVVISAPSINAAAFARDQIVISGDFGPEEAERIAASLRGGDVEMRPVLLALGPEIGSSPEG